LKWKLTGIDRQKPIQSKVFICGLHMPNTGIFCRCKHLSRYRRKHGPRRKPIRTVVHPRVLNRQRRAARQVFLIEIRGAASNSAYSGYPELWILRYPAHRYHAVPSQVSNPRPSHAPARQLLFVEDNARALSWLVTSNLASKNNTLSLSTLLCKRRHHTSEVQQHFSTRSLSDVSWGKVRNLTV
jgi:hypothetical protein